VNDTPFSEPQIVEAEKGVTMNHALWMALCAGVIALSLALALLFGFDLTADSFGFPDGP
jgi:hypothetical protein